MSAHPRVTMLKDKHFYLYAAVIIIAGIFAAAALALVGTDSPGCPKPGDPISRPGAEHCYYKTPVGG